MKQWLICLLSVALGGCLSPYVAPSGNVSTATISFEAKGEPTLGFGATFVMRESSIDHSCNRKSLTKMAQIFKGNPFAQTDNPADITIAAEVRIGLRAFFIPANLLGQIGCTYDIDFTPEKNKRYKVIIEWSRAGCRVDLQNETNKIWSTVPQPFNVQKISC